MIDCSTFEKFDSLVSLTSPQEVDKELSEVVECDEAYIGGQEKH